MSLLIESIKLLDGKFYNLAGHEERMKRSLAELFQSNGPFNLEGLISKHYFPRQGCYKCRILYDDASTNVSFVPYEVRTIGRVKVIEDDDVSYSYKFADRTQINRLFNERGDCDDVLIIRRGKVTDLSYANVVFRKDARWYTPDSPLLRGTMRAKLLGNNIIEEREIRKGDIRSFDSFKLINALLEFDGPEIDVSDLVF